MAVELQFLPPETEDIATLHVEESSSQGGPFTEVQTFPAGTYPNYIDAAVVTNAVSPSDWFRIRWQDAQGGFTPYSSPVAGGTTTIVAQVKDRVVLRDPGINRLVAAQEAEAAVAEYFGVDDPYSISPSSANPRILSGLTLLTLARAYTLRLISQGSATKWTAGLLSMDVSTSGQTKQNIEELIALANRELNRNYSAVLMLKELQVADGVRTLKVYDVSRTMIEIA